MFLVGFHDSGSNLCGTDLYGVRDGQAGGTARSEDAHAPPPAAPEDDHAPPVLVDNHASPPQAPEVDELFHESDPDFCGTDLYGARDGQAGGTAHSKDAHDPPPTAPEDDHAPPVLVADHDPPPPAPEVDELFHDSDPDFCGTDLYGVRDGQAGGTARSEDDHDPPPAAPEDDHAPSVLVDDHAPLSLAPEVDELFHDSDPDFCGTDLYGVRDGQAGGTARSEDGHAPPPAAPEDDHAPPVLVDDHAPPAAAPVKLLPEVGLEVASS